MDTVKVERQRLIKTVTENRDKHAKEYSEACVEYRAAALNIIDQSWNDFNKNVLEKISNGEVVTVEAIFFEIDVPISHVKQYDEILMMLDMCVDDEVVISQRDFRRFVLDEWEWKQTELSKRLFYAANSVGISQ